MSAPTKTAQKVRRHFEDCNAASSVIQSLWATVKAQKASRSVQCQTSEEIYVFRESEIQSGRGTSVLQDQVPEKNSKMTLIDYLTTKYPKKGEEAWKGKIEDGFVTVDCEVVTDPESRVDTEYFLEFVDCKAHVGVQTTPAKDAAEQLSEWRERQCSSPKLQEFLARVSPKVLEALGRGVAQRDVFQNNLPASASADEGGQSALQATYYRQCTVDLEKKRVVFPDWNKARRFQGVIVRTTVTRNKDRVYDIEYDDGARCNAVKEEYIRLLGDAGSKAGRGRDAAAPLAGRIREGVRVHCRRVVGKTSAVKYFPGRVTRVSKSANGLFMCDVDVEGSGQVESNVLIEDLLVGLQEGQRVEAKRPVTVKLQATGVSYNTTGNILAASYGRHDVLGWCDSAGAVACWNISARAPAASSAPGSLGSASAGDEGARGPADVAGPGAVTVLAEPECVLDHNSCLMAVACHPAIPSIVAAGSYNGEVLVWDLTNQDQPPLVSPISEYGHQQPVLSVSWVQLPSRAAGDSQPFLLCSVGADGRILFWSTRNRLQHPVKGFMINKDRAATSRRQGSSTMGTSCFAFTPASSSSGQRPAQWLVLGQEDGRVMRYPSQKLFSQDITAEAIKAMPSPEDVFPFLSKRCDGTPMAALIGPVTSMDYSPFHRYLVLVGGCDGTVRLCHILQRSPVLSLEPAAFVPVSPIMSKDSASQTALCSVTAIAFSPVRPAVFAAATSEGFVYVYDLYRDTSAPVMRIEVSSGTRSEDKRAGKGAGVEPVAVTGLSFNGKRRELLTACDWQGRVHIWRLPSVLCELQSQPSRGDATEQALWDRLGRVHGGGEQEEEA